MVAAKSKRPSDRYAGLRKGVLELLVLRMASAEKLYAGEMLKRLDRSGFKTGEGTLYPLLGRLRREGLIEHEWKESAAGPPRKYYALTRAGGQRLEALMAFMAQVSEAVAKAGA